MQPDGLGNNSILMDYAQKSSRMNIGSERSSDMSINILGAVYNGGEVHRS